MRRIPGGSRSGPGCPEARRRRGTRLAQPGGGALGAAGGRADRAEAGARAAQALDPRKTQVVELKFFGGLSAREIAEVLGSPTPRSSGNGRSPGRGSTRRSRERPKTPEAKATGLQTRLSARLRHDRLQVGVCPLPESAIRRRRGGLSRSASRHPARPAAQRPAELDRVEPRSERARVLRDTARSDSAESVSPAARRRVPKSGSGQIAHTSVSTAWRARSAPRSFSLRQTRIHATGPAPVGQAIPAQRTIGAVP